MSEIETGQKWRHKKRGAAQRDVWQPIETAPEGRGVGWGEQTYCLLYGPRVGICYGEIGAINGQRWANIGHLGGNAIDDWGVTHWKPLPQPPSCTHEQSKTKNPSSSR